MAEYTIPFTEEHIVEAASRFRSDKRVPLFLWPIKFVCFLGLGGLMALCAYHLVWVPMFILAPFIVLLALGPRVDYWLMKRRFRKSPFYNGNVRISVTQAGFVSSDAKSRVELAWSAFTRATHFSDGFLVFSGPQQFWWWPNSALVAGNSAEVEQLLRSSVSKFRDA